MGNPKLIQEKIKVLVITGDPYNNISFYRATGPLNQLKEHVWYTIEEYVWNRYGGFGGVEKGSFHALLITCPYTQRHLDIIKTCKEKGIKIWLDFDDFITEIPVWNVRGFLEYSQHPVLHVLNTACGLADFITVSTEYLKEQLIHLNKEVHVIPNAFDDEFLTHPAPAGIKKEVLYRGGESHNIDLWEYRQPILNSLKDSNYDIHFVGMNPIYINMELNGTWTPQLSKPNYWSFLENNTAGILIVPLKDIPFNHAKSCIAWIEGTYAGCAVLAPDWTEWQKPGVMNYTNKVDFEGKLKGMMSGRINLKERVNKSREYIMNCQTLKKVNEQRLKLLEKHCK